MILSTLRLHVAVAPTGFFAMMPARRGAATMPPLLLAVMPAWRCAVALRILLLAVVDARRGARSATVFFAVGERGRATCESHPGYESHDRDRLVHDRTFQTACLPGGTIAAPD